VMQPTSEAEPGAQPRLQALRSWLRVDAGGSVAGTKPVREELLWSAGSVTTSAHVADDELGPAITSSARAEAHAQQKSDEETTEPEPFVLDVGRMPDAYITLNQDFRPPRQTSTQATVLAELHANASTASAAALSGTLELMEALRENLHPTLHELTSEELLERFKWEFEHLQLFHNAPTSPDNDLELFRESGYNSSYLPGQHNGSDDSPVLSSLYSGVLQNSCVRQAIGGPQRAPNGYPPKFTWMGMPESAYGTKDDDDGFEKMQYTLREANECFLFNANNLWKDPSGNAIYGGMTWVLSPETTKGRLIVAPGDTGFVYAMTEGGGYGGIDVPFPGFGTEDHWYHLLAFHVALLNVNDRFSNDDAPAWKYSLADVFNHWYAPDDGNEPSYDGAWPYFEILLAGHAHLPEDLHFGIAQYGGVDILPGSEEAMPDTTVDRGDDDEFDHSGAFGTSPTAHHAGMFGSHAGNELRSFMGANGRPLLWNQMSYDTMLLDPLVIQLANGRIQPECTQEDVDLFNESWTGENDATNKSYSAQQQRFEKLVTSVPSRLKLTYLSWDTREACADVEADSTTLAIGVNGEGECVYYKTDGPAPTKWELFNDGSCALSADPLRAVYATEAECEAATTRWKCVQVEAQYGPGTAVAYCMPSTTELGAAEFGSVSSCEAACLPPDSTLVSVQAAAVGRRSAAMQDQEEVEELIAELTAQWLAGTPDNELSQAGLLVHVLDSGGQFGPEVKNAEDWIGRTTGEHLWKMVGRPDLQPSLSRANYTDRVSTSIINRAFNETYHPGLAWTVGTPTEQAVAAAMLDYRYLPTIVLDETAVDNRFSCCYPNDGGSMAVLCTPLGGDDSCVPGCRLQSDRGLELGSDLMAFSKEQLKDCLEAQVAASTNGMDEYNEVILDTWRNGGWSLAERTPRALFIDVRASAAGMQLAWDVQAAIQADTGVLYPLLTYDGMTEAPFAVAKK